MSNFAYSHIQTIATYEDLLGFARQLLSWLLVEVNENEPFAESRAKALLRATEVVDDPTLHDFARLMGNEKAVRAVGAANGKNPLSIVVPCHRVIGSGGQLTGYAGEVWRKKWLLEHESNAVYVTQQSLF